MAKVAIIGAGSLIFFKTLMNDFLSTPALAGSEYCLMALTHKRLDKMHDFVQRMIKDNNIKAIFNLQEPGEVNHMSKSN